MFQQAKAPVSIRGDRIEIAGIGVDNLSEDETLDSIQRLIEAGGNHYGAVVNAAKLALARRSPELARALESADLVTADGMSVVWASRLLGQGLKGRVTGIDLMGKLVERAGELGQPVYFLGAREEAVRGTVDYFASKCPRLRVAGYRDGYFAADDWAGVADKIRQSG